MKKELSTMGEPRSRAGQLMEHQQALVSLRSFQESQRALTLANSRASALSLMLSLGNRADNARLERQQNMLRTRLALGERALVQLRDQVSNQSETLGSLSGQVDRHEQDIDTLRESVEEQEKSLERLVQQYKEELSEQRQLILNQQLEFKRMVFSKLKQDATLDVVILLLSWVFVRSPFVNWPVQMVSFVTGFLPLVPLHRKQRNALVTQLARIAIGLACARSMRVMAAKKGLHNSVGSPQVYFSQSLQAVRDLLAIQRASQQPKLPVHDADGDVTDR